jgi:hypothetical protein
MRNYKKYRSTVITSFQPFLAGEKTKTELIDDLVSIEKKLKNGAYTTKGLWFRFFKGDCLATTIDNLQYDNSNYYKECMQLSIDNPKELQIYYS